MTDSTPRITAQDIVDAIRAANEEAHGVDQLGWFDACDLSSVVIDGVLNLERVAELINANPAASPDAPLSIDN